jgi:predicted DNA-binding transcriptional regulator YafY
MLKFKPQFKRLQFVHAEIKKGGYPNCRRLAERWEISAKTIQRDIDYLKYDQKAPIEYDPVQHGYYYTDKTYDLPAIRISEGDLFALAIAEKALAAYRNTPIYDRLLTIFAKIQESLPEKISVHPSWVDAKFSIMPTPSTRINPAIWETVAQALRANRVLQIQHQVPGTKGPLTRKVDPYHMMSFKGEWYLIGRDHYRQQVLTFGISRIRAAEALSEEVEGGTDFEVESYLRSHFGVFVGDKQYNVKIWFSSDAAPFIRERDRHPSQKIKENKDGSLVLSLQVSHLLEIRRWALSWGSDAKVLSPKELRNPMRDELRATLRMYVRDST